MNKLPDGWIPATEENSALPKKTFIDQSPTGEATRSGFQFSCVGIHPKKLKAIFECGDPYMRFVVVNYHESFATLAYDHYIEFRTNWDDLISNI